MTSTEFVLNKINQIQTAFSDISIRYESDQCSESHFIEISPLEEYDNQTYVKLEEAINLEFIKLFPFELLTFINESDNFSFENPLLFKSVNSNKHSLDLNLMLSNFLNNASFKTAVPAKLKFKGNTVADLNYMNTFNKRIKKTGPTKLKLPNLDDRIGLVAVPIKTSIETENGEYFLAA